jgi:insulysin
MEWPVPGDLLLAGPQLVWEWGDDETGPKEVRRILDSLTINNGRALLMAKAEEHKKFGASDGWETEPIYGSQYRVEKLENDFLEQVNRALRFRHLHR